MNIEIANRLVKLRKGNGLSQEALAEKLGISRQAVSKWERAEASPDTDNLIMLAKLYSVSLDELLLTEEESQEPSEGAGDMYRPEYGKNPEPAGGEEGFMEAQEPEAIGAGKGREAVGKECQSGAGGPSAGGSGFSQGVGEEGIPVLDKDGSEVHVSWDGIHVEERQNVEAVHRDVAEVRIEGKKRRMEWVDRGMRFPLPVFVAILYFSLGMLFGAWHPAWLLFFLIPLWYSFLGAVKKRNAHIFAYPVFVTFLFLCAGFFLGAWNPGWILFLTIPAYYPLTSYWAGRGE